MSWKEFSETNIDSLDRARDVLCVLFRDWGQRGLGGIRVKVRIRVRAFLKEMSKQDFSRIYFVVIWFDLV